MKFQTERDRILGALTTAARGVGRSQAPFVNLSLTGNSLSVEGSDSDITIESTIDVAGKKDGVVNLPPRLAVDIVKAFESGAVEFNVTDTETTVTSGRAEFALRNVAGAEVRPIRVDGDEIEIPVEPFIEGLRQVARAALTDDTRAPQLTGVLLQQREDGIRLVATDSYRLAFKDIPAITQLGIEDDVLIPARALTEVQRLATESDVITFAKNEHLARFNVENTRITTRLLNGPFPDYARLIPDKYPVSFVADRKELITAIKRVQTVIRSTKDNTTPIRLNLEDGGVTLSAFTAEAGRAEDRVDGKLTGDSTLVAFNSAYLIDGLDAITTDDVTIQVIDSSKPATLRDDLYSYLLMPVRVS